jgi:predicted nucleic acid-binding protein
VAAVYLDASAIAKLFLDEAGTRELAAVIATATERATSIVSLIEVPRAVARRRPSMTLAEIDAVSSRIVVIGLDDAIATRAAALPPTSLRTLDSIQLASALELVPDLESFVTYDTRLAEAARAAGLRVSSPGLAPA